MKTLTEDKTRIVQAYGVLDQIDASQSVTFSIVGADGQSQSFEASPEVIQGMKSGLTGVLFGKTQDWSQDLQFDSRDQVATALDIEPDQLEGLAAHGGGSSLRAEDIVPYLHQNNQRDAQTSV